MDVLLAAPEADRLTLFSYPPNQRRGTLQRRGSFLDGPLSVWVILSACNSFPGPGGVLTYSSPGLFCNV
jgi:hypothetical protein